MITREERSRTLHEVVAVSITCDMCGEDATGRVFGHGVNSSVFKRCQRNTLENRLSEYGAINETVLTHEAELCEACAAEVADFIDSRAWRHPGAWGVREVRR